MLTGLSLSLLPSAAVQSAQSKIFFSYKEIVSANNSQCHGAEKTSLPLGNGIDLSLEFFKITFP